MTENINIVDEIISDSLVPIIEENLSDPILDKNITVANSDYSFLQIDERAYKYIRQFAIKNLTDGIVELITNSLLDVINCFLF